MATPAQRSEIFALRAYPLLSGDGAVPAAIIGRIARELRAGAPTDAVLLLADQARAIATHVALMGATHMAARWRDLAALVTEFAEPPHQGGDTA